MPFALTAVPSGGWSWFADPRALYLPNANKTVLGYAADISGSQSQELRSYDHASGTVSAPVVLHTTAGNSEDHGPLVFLRRASDGRLLTFYHNSDAETVIYSRLSTNPDDVTAWGAQTDITSQIGGGQGVHYFFNPLQLTGESGNPIYLWYTQYSTDGVPRQMGYSKSLDGGAIWSASVAVFQTAGSWAYFKIATNGTDRIDFVVTNNHPAHAPASLYHFYYHAGQYYQSNGTQIGVSLPFDESHFTRIWDGSSVRGWIWDVAIEAGTGYPVAVFVTFPGANDFRYEYARWNGTSWVVTQICTAGGPLYAAEIAYAGGIAIDRADTSIVYASRNITGQWEMWRCQTSDSGASWTGQALTNGSSNPQIRPVAVRNAAGGLAVVWLTGRYTTYNDYNQAIVGIAAQTGRGGGGMASPYTPSNVGAVTFTSTGVTAGFNQAAVFTGANYLDFTANPPPSMMAAAGTAWTQHIRVKTSSGSGTQIAASCYSTGGGNWWVGISDGKAHCSVSGIDGPVSATINDNAWHVLKLCHTGSQFYFFVDGALQNAGGTAQAWTQPVTYLGIYLGAFLTTPSYFWTGQLDEFATFGVCQNTASYTAETAPFAYNVANGIALLHLDGTPADTYGTTPQPETLASTGTSAAALTVIARQLETLASTAAAAAALSPLANPYNPTNVGGVTFTSTGVPAPFGQAAVFNLSDYLDLTANVPPAMNPPSGSSFSVSCRVNSTNPTNYNAAVSCFNAGGTAGYTLQTNNIDGKAGLNFNGATVVSSVNVCDGANHEMMMCVDGTHAYLLVDGALTNTITSPWVQATSPGVTIGAQKFGSGGSPIAPFPGNIDEVAAFSACLHTASYTPASAPYSNTVANGCVLLHMDGNALDSYGVLVTAQPETLAATGTASVALTPIEQQAETIAATASATATLAELTRQVLTVAASGTGTAGLTLLLSDALSLAATGTATAALVPTLTQAVTLATSAGASATLVAILKDVLSLAASGAASSALTPLLTQALSLSSTSIATAALAAQALAPTTLAGVATAAAALSATIQQLVSMAATGTATAALVPTLTQAVTLATSAGASATLVAILKDVLSLAASGAASSALTPLLTQALSLSSTSIATAALAAQALAPTTLAGVATAAAALSATIRQLVSMAATGTATAALTVQPLAPETLASIASAALTLVPTLLQTLALSGQAASTATITPSLLQSVALSALGNAAGSLAASTSQALSLPASAAVSAALSPLLIQAITLAGTGAAHAALVTTLQDALALAATGTATASIMPLLTQSMNLAAQAGASAALTATVQEALSLTAPAQATAALSVLLKQSETLAATATASAQLGTGGQMPISLAAQASATAGLVPGLTIGEALAATSNATAALTTTIAQSVLLGATGTSSAALVPSLVVLTSALNASAAALATMNVTAPLPGPQLHAVAEGLAELTPLLVQYLSLHAAATGGAILRLPQQRHARVRVLSMVPVGNIHATIAEYVQ